MFFGSLHWETHRNKVKQQQKQKKENQKFQHRIYFELFRNFFSKGILKVVL